MSQPHIPHAPHTPKLGAASTAIVAIVTANPLAYLAMPTKRTAPDLSPWVPERHEAARPEGKRAFELPSRDGDKFAPYTGPKPMCVGRLADVRSLGR